MRGRLWRPLSVGLLAAALLAAAAGLSARATGLMGWLERPTIDARFSLRGGVGAPQKVTLVSIDNTTVAELPRHPFPRELDARVIENLHAAGARLIVYDEAFDRQTTPREDAALERAAARAAPIVFATTLIKEGEGETEVLGGNERLAAKGDEAGAAYLPVDADGVVRHTLYEAFGLRSIAAAVAGHIKSDPPARSSYEGGWIDFAGAPGTFRSVSFLSVLDNRFDRALVRGRVVVVGATAPVIQDLHPTAAGSPMSGPELQANAIVTALQDFPLRGAPGAVTILLILAMAALAPAAARMGAKAGGRTAGAASLAALAAALAGAALFSLATQLSFDRGTVVDYADPLLALAVGTLAAISLGLVAERTERRELRLRFAAGASTLVDQVLHDPRGRPLPPTAVIAGYRLEEVLARGGMGVVYRATQLALKRRVAVKLITPAHAHDESFRVRFERESRIAASIEHANVIPVYEAGEDNGLLFIAMRLVEGTDLEALLERGGALEPARAARIVGQVAGALDAAHARGLVHRDVKPANVLITLDEPEHAYLTDFGVAKQVGAPAALTRAGQWVGTLDYLAPEQIECEEVTAAADVYSLAAMLYHCVTGHPPYERPNDAARIWAHLSAEPPKASALRPELPRALDAVIARGLAKSPGSRFESAGALARACTRALGIEEPVAQSLPDAEQREQRPRAESNGAATLIAE